VELFAKVHGRNPSTRRRVPAQEGIIVGFDEPVFDLGKVRGCPFLAPEGPMEDVHRRDSDEEK
jgi:hypothetical protein